MSDGLKAFAGEALRRILLRFTGTPGKAFASGAVVTAIIQSSSATTVTLIGFVSAGLLTFPQAVGIVFGASLGTTGTGWLVSVLGLKFSVGLYALPLLGIGAFMKLLAHGRWKAFGLALAGFSLIFVGIDTLQEGMRNLSQFFDLATLPSGSFFGSAMAVGVGFMLTVVMQSSSAAVATTLTALHAQSVNFEQAALLVIGAAVGTTVKGALVTIGGTVPAKRTALAHIVFNLATGVIAVILLPAFLFGIRLAQRHLGLEPGATSLAAFHTLFIGIGVAIFLPLAHPFAAWASRRLPEKGPRLTAYLDASVLHLPAVALEASRRALCETAGQLAGALNAMLEIPAKGGAVASQTDIRDALERIQLFFAAIPPIAENMPLSKWRVAQMHAIDHLLRLQARLLPPSGIRSLLTSERLRPALDLTRSVLVQSSAVLCNQAPAAWIAALGQDATELAGLNRHTRAQVLNQAVSDGMRPDQALNVLDAMRWLERISYHTWRICNYLCGEGSPEPVPAAGDPHPDD